MLLFSHATAEETKARKVGLPALSKPGALRPPGVPSLPSTRMAAHAVSTVTGWMEAQITPPWACSPWIQVLMVAPCACPTPGLCCSALCPESVFCLHISAQDPRDLPRHP